MPCGRLDDSLYDHPKLDLIPVEERLAAIGLWARAISWCNRFLTDGLVPRDRIAKLDGTPALADRLVAAGLFEPAPHGYLIHDYLAFNVSREKTLEQRQYDAERKAKWRAERDAAKRVDNSAKKPSGRSHTGTPRTKRAPVPAGVPPESQAESQRDSRTRESRPDPTRPSSSTGIRDSHQDGARDGNRHGDPTSKRRNTVADDPLLSEIRDALAANTPAVDPWS